MYQQFWKMTFIIGFNITESVLNSDFSDVIDIFATVKDRKYDF